MARRKSERPARIALPDSQRATPPVAIQQGSSGFPVAPVDAIDLTAFPDDDAAPPPAKKPKSNPKPAVGLQNNSEHHINYPVLRDVCDAGLLEPAVDSLHDNCDLVDACLFFDEKPQFRRLDVPPMPQEPSASLLTLGRLNMQFRLSEPVPALGSYAAKLAITCVETAEGQVCNIWTTVADGHVSSLVNLLLTRHCCGYFPALIKNRHKSPVELRADAFQIVISGATTMLSIDFDVLVQPDTSYECLNALFGFKKRYSFMDQAKEFKAALSPASVLAQVQPSVDEECPIVKPGGLTCDLFAFQMRSVSWMLRREGMALDLDGSVDPLTEADSNYHDVDPFMASSKSSKLLMDANFKLYPTEKLLKPGELTFGGMLCEEMGLGKTLEVISLILLHPKTEHFKYDKLVDSKATLIVAPSSIIEQWQGELAARCPGLRVKNYGGIRENLEPNDFAKYDVILADYAVLQKELNFFSSDNQRSRRFEREYERKESPLKKVHFWRICIDEVQMIDSSGSIGKVTSQLFRRNSWAITGTPIQRHAFLNLLDMTKHIAVAVPRRSLTTPETFMRLMKILMIRNTKACVANELHIPTQHESLAVVKFSPVERHYYNQIRREMTREIPADCLAGKKRIVFGVEREYDRGPLLEFLLRFRQTCSHVQIGGQNQAALGRLDQQVQTVQEVLSTIVKQAKTSCLALLRQKLALTFKAGLLQEMRKDYAAALESYQLAIDSIKPEVLRMRGELNQSTALHEDTAEEEAKTALHTWAILLHQVIFCKACVHLEMQDKPQADELFQEAEEIRKALMGKIEAAVLEEMAQVKELVAESPFLEKFESLKDSARVRERGLILPLHVEAINGVIVWLNKQVFDMRNYREKVVDAVFQDLHQDYSKDAAIQDLGHVCQTYYQEAIRERRFAVSGPFFDDYLRPPEFKTKRKPLDAGSRQEQLGLESGVEVAAPEFRPPPPPRKADKANWLRKFVDLFEGKLVELLAQGRQSKAIAVEIQIMRETLTSLKQLVKDEAAFLVVCDKEVACFARVWNKRIAFYKSLQKLSDDVAIPEILDLDREEEERARVFAFVSRSLELEQGKLRYLQSMDDASHNGQSDSCLICQDDFQDSSDIAVAKCGHMFCKKCLMAWMTQKRNCPLCKIDLKVSKDVKFVKKAQSPISSVTVNPAAIAKPPAEQQHALIIPRTTYPFPAELPQLSKNFGAKIDLIVRHIRFLVDKDPYTFKCLLFSQWNEMLSVFEHAFAAEGIRFLNFGSKKGPVPNKQMPQIFKTDPMIKVLMMNAKSQSAGLTLVNASHVFLVEPSLNPAIERQAVGRVHRLGQGKETWVHRYMVEDSVEEGIFRLKNSASEQQPAKAEKSEDIAANDLLFLLNREVDF